MRSLVTILMASVAGFAGIQAATAADAIDQIPQAPVAQNDYAAPAGNWSGAYVGGSANYNFGRFRHGDDHDAKALGGALYGGYNMQSGQIVYGGETDIGYTGADSAAGPGLTGKQRWNGSVRGRVGYDASPFLVYGTAGLALTDNKISNGTNSDDRVLPGYTVGAGVETMVTNNVTARVEYRYSDYSSRTFTLGNESVSRDFNDHSVKVGMGVKF